MSDLVIIGPSQADVGNVALLCHPEVGCRQAERAHDHGGHRQGDPEAIVEMDRKWLKDSGELIRMMVLNMVKKCKECLKYWWIIVNNGK